MSVAKGIIYVMTTVVPGLVKIGKTGTSNFENRMYALERNGYFNVVGLKREFAIEVEDYDEKEDMLDEIFSRSRVPNSELFALDIDLVKQLLSSFEGRQVYPKAESKDEVFDKATEELSAKDSWSVVPDGEYYLSRKDKTHGHVEATMQVKDGSFIVKSGSRCLPVPEGHWMPEARRTAHIESGVLAEDVACNAPSTAGWIVLGHSCNGWTCWKDQNGKAIDQFRKRK